MKKPRRMRWKYVLNAYRCDGGIPPVLVRPTLKEIDDFLVEFGDYKQVANMVTNGKEMFLLTVFPRRKAKR